MKIHQALSELQRKLSVPKTRINTFANYKYRNAEDILEAVKQALPEGAYVKCTDEIEVIGGRVYMHSVAVFGLGTDTVCSSGYAREPESKKGSDESQITGAASSYARKYALCGLFAIDDGIDADAHDNREAKVAPKKAATPTPKPKAVDTPRGLADRLITRIHSFVEAEGLYKWAKDQQVADARDQLYLADKELSREVDEALTNQLDRLEPSKGNQ